MTQEVGHHLNGLLGMRIPAMTPAMENLTTLTTFFGWCTIISFSILLISMIGLISLKGTAIKIHGQLFGLDEKTLNAAYFSYLGNLKICSIAFAFVPWLALKLMA